jgi:hypothetical protein
MYDVAATIRFYVDYLGCSLDLQDGALLIRRTGHIVQGPGSRAAGLAMAFKLIESAQGRWRAVNAPHRVALVRAGATFVNGKLIERPGENTEPEAA